MDQRNAGADAANVAEWEKLSKEALDAMSIGDVVAHYHKLARLIRTRTLVTTRFLAKTEARTEEQYGNVNECRRRLMADMMAEAEALKLYVKTRMITA